EPLTWELWQRALAQNTLEFQGALMRLESVARMIVTFLGQYDMLLSPALAQLPVPIGEINGLGEDPFDSFRRSGHFTPYTAIFNVTGQPAISLPLYQSDDGLPLAIQLAGRPAREDQLLALATQLEQALPWQQRCAEL
ncbi:MAG: amidase, partial [Streptosporangiaceae bacterium]|nr:amidase [Streptosporangiaceae bacterium]